GHHRRRHQGRCAAPGTALERRIPPAGPATGLRTGASCESWCSMGQDPVTIRSFAYIQRYVNVIIVTWSEVQHSWEIESRRGRDPAHGTPAPTPSLAHNTSQRRTNAT